MAQDWNRVQTLFHAAVGAAPAQQAALLDRADLDPQTRAEVASLLDHDASASESRFLEWHELSSSPPQEIVGQYRLLSRIGMGGSGVVYRACHVEDTRRKVAVKLLRSSFVDACTRQRFANERRALAELNHPGVARLIDWGNSEEGTPYLVMDLVEGRRIDQCVGERRIPLTERIHWFLQIARTVVATHAQGISHRDLKPANILVTTDGRPVITDFGLAKLDPSRGSGVIDMTNTGSTLGTPGYMAPEQIDSQRGSSGFSVDIYGLGALLYFLLTNQPPFRESSMAETLVAIREQAPVAPRQLASDCDKDVETICLHCLHKRPDQRYACAEALVGDVENYLAGLPIKARPLSPAQRTLRWIVRNPMTSGLFGTVAVMTLVAWGALTYSYVQASRQNARLVRTVDRLFTVHSKWLQTHPATQDLREELLEHAHDLHQEIAQASTRARESRIALAEATFRLADLYTNLHETDLALVRGQEALAQFRALQHAYPQEHRFRFDVFHCQRLLRRSEDAYETIATLGQEFPIPIYLDAWAAAARSLAGKRRSQGDLAGAAACTEVGLAAATQLKEAHPEGLPDALFHRRHYDALWFLKCELAEDTDGLQRHATEARERILEAMSREPNHYGYTCDLLEATRAYMHASIARDAWSDARDASRTCVHHTRAYLDWDPHCVNAWNVYFHACQLRLKHPDQLFQSAPERAEFLERLRRDLATFRHFWPHDTRVVGIAKALNKFEEVPDAK